MTIGLTYAELKSLSPCSDILAVVVKMIGGAEKWGDNKVTAQQARDAGCSFENIVWAVSAAARRDRDIERRIRLWGTDCAARVLHIYEIAGNSEAPRNAIIAGRRFAHGLIDGAARDAARNAA